MPKTPRFSLLYVHFFGHKIIYFGPFKMFGGGGWEVACDPPLATPLLDNRLEWMSLDEEEFQNSKEVQKI